MKTKTTPTPIKINPEIYMQEHFKAVMHYLSFGVRFPSQIKKGNVELEYLAFVRKALECSAKHPQLIPGYTELPNVVRDNEMKKDLKMFASDATESLNKIWESNGKVDYAAYAYAVAFLENVKNAADKKVNVGEKVYKELQKEFPAARIRQAA